MDEARIIEEVDRLLPEVCKSLHAAVAAHPAAARRTIPQIRALAFLYHHAPATVGEVAAGVGVGMPAASELIDRLVEEGLVERSANPADRRQVLLRLTPRAREHGDRLHALRRAQIRAALDRLAPEERPYLLRAIQALAEALRETPAVADPTPPASPGRGSDAVSDPAPLACM
jgi:DNA-binding MarR family transcriptional regulator